MSDTVNIEKFFNPLMRLWYPTVHPKFNSHIILQISHGEYTLFSANFFDGFRALVESLKRCKIFEIGERKVQIIAMMGS